jgi:lipoprotein-anchoring transpeptidase ErfK/SrfK
MITESLTAMANKYAVTPVDQVTVVHEDGIPTVIMNGKNGIRLTNPSSLKEQANLVAKTLMDSKGISFNTPLETVPFQALTAEAYDKLIEVNVNTKILYAYEKGQLVKTFPISAGAPKTPTPIGQFKIFSKMPVQDMKGFNADGSKYFQPNVRWISYFLPGGYGIHGNYWRPASWFGNINSSHGCVSLPDAQAKWVYDFAPVGTTIINHF